MSKIRVNKSDVARRQIDAAIRMTFAGEDPIAIHSIAAAGQQIIRDLCEAKGNIESYLRFTDWIAPGHEREFWHHLNASANFFKHADRDADRIHDLDEEWTDYVIVFTSRWYADLGFALTCEMRVFGGWFATCHPNTIKSDAKIALQYAGILGQMQKMSEAMSQLPRPDRLKAGGLALEKAKRAL